MYVEWGCWECNYMLGEQCSWAHPCAAGLLLILAVLSVPWRAEEQELMACRHLFRHRLSCFSCDTGASFVNIAFHLLPTNIFVSNCSSWAKITVVLQQMQFMNDSLLSLVWFSAFPVLKSVVCLDFSERLWAAAFWSGVDSSARGHPGVCSQGRTWKRFAWCRFYNLKRSEFGGSYCPWLMPVHIWFRFSWAPSCSCCSA